VIVFVAYLAVNWALMIAANPASGGTLTVLLDVVDATLGGFFKWVVGLIILGFFVFITVVYNYSFARLLFVSGLDRRLPPAVSKVNSNRVPYVAVIIQTILASLFAVGTYLVYPYVASGGSAADLSNRAYFVFQAAVTVIWLLSMVFLFVDVLVIINRYKAEFEERKIAHPSVFIASSIVGSLACAWGAIVTFTNPWTPLVGKGDWFRILVLLCAVSLLAAPILYVLGRSAARQAPLPPEAGSETGVMAGAGR
jgi:amino acid transporter